MRKQLDIRWTALPGNSGFAIPFDSTRGPANMSWAGLAAGSPFLAPGAWRAMFNNIAYRYMILCATNNVVVDEQLLTGVAGTSADWTTQDPAGTDPGQYTVTAGTPVWAEFKPLSPDHRILVSAGATGPTALRVLLSVYSTQDYGG